MQSLFKSAAARQMAYVAFLAAAQLGVSGAAQASCGSAFCAVNTHWDAQGLWDKPGLRADLRFEFLDQDQPRHGSDKVAIGEIPAHHDEVRTINRNTVLNLDYGFDEHWGVSLILPYVNRSHDHIHNHHGTPIPEAWDFSEPGDVRVIGRYQFSLPAFQETRYGLKFGVKLPTGAHDITNDDGDPAERTLQPGSGSTDVILGGYFQHPVTASKLRWFGQALWQQALNERKDFRPGYTLSLDGGLNYGVNSRLTALLQANVQIKGRDSGAEAEREDSGAQTLAISPGIGYALTRTTQIYGFVQLPLYQYVNGVQLTGDIAYVAGVSMVF